MQQLQSKGNRKRRWTDNIFVLWLLTAVLTYSGLVLGAIIVFLTIPQESDAAITGSRYFAYIGMCLTFLIYLFFVKKNRPIIERLWRKPEGNRFSFLLLGGIVGFAMNGVCVLIAWLHRDIHLQFHIFQPLSLVLLLFCVLVPCIAEELATRVFLYERLRGGYEHPLVAILGNSLFFAILHLTNKGITVLSVLNILLAGLAMSLVVYYYDSIWFAIAFHTAWNFTQNIIFGLPNSGIVLPYSVFRLDMATDSFAYNVGFGIEGTATVDVLLIGFCLVVYLLGSRRREKNKVEKAA